MITVSQVETFDDAPWRATSHNVAAQAAELNARALGLRLTAAMIRLRWQSATAVAAADAYEDMADEATWTAEGLTDGSQIIDTATNDLVMRQTDLQTARSPLAGHPMALTDLGHVSFLTDFHKLPQTDQDRLRGVAEQVSFDVRAILSAAGHHLSAMELSLDALLGESPPTDLGGPLDLDDESILQAAAVNQQDAYGDCVTLSMLLGQAQADPSWVRDHLRWDPLTDSYMVTLYDTAGAPYEVAVDPDTLPTDGAQAYGSGDPTWISVMEQAYRQEFPGFVGPNGGATTTTTDDVAVMVTGQTGATRGPVSFADMQATLTGPPPGTVVVDTGTPAAPQAPPHHDPASSVVGGHAYTVVGFDDQGRVILQNPWGPNGGWVGGTFYPGEVYLTETEYQQWMSNATLVPGS